MSGFAQLLDAGKYVAVPKGTQLCAQVAPGTPRTMPDPEKLFGGVTSNVRANGAQTAAPFVLEASCGGKTGETTVSARKYEQDYATLSREILSTRGRS